MWRNVIFTTVLLCALTSAAPTAISAESCVRYGSGVSLTGRLVRQQYAGPPDYESVTKGDTPQTIWVLVLDRYICADDPTARQPREVNEHEVQLVMTPELYTRYQPLLGTKIAATGKLIHGGARYDKRLALMTDEIVQVSLTSR